MLFVKTDSIDQIINVYQSVRYVRIMKWQVASVSHVCKGIVLAMGNVANKKR